MQLVDMISAIQRRVDDVVAQTDAIEWLNAGLHVMEIAVEASFPPLDGVSVTTFPFPERYHIIPVLYAAAKFKERDVMLPEAQNYFGQFNDQLKYFTERYDVPAQYRDHSHVQQFTATAGQMAYVITKDTYNPNSARLKVYINGRANTDWQLPQSPASNPSLLVTTTTTTNDPNGFIFNPTTTINAGDVVTAEWEIHEDFDEPPYGWWSW